MDYWGIVIRAIQYGKRSVESVFSAKCWKRALFLLELIHKEMSIWIRKKSLKMIYIVIAYTYLL